MRDMNENILRYIKNCTALRCDPQKRVIIYRLNFKAFVLKLACIFAWWRQLRVERGNVGLKRRKLRFFSEKTVAKKRQWKNTAGTELRQSEFQSDAGRGVRTSTEIEWFIPYSDLRSIVTDFRKQSFYSGANIHPAFFYARKSLNTKFTNHTTGPYPERD